MQKFRVALLGLESLFGQTSSLLLKQCPNIYNLRLYDENNISVAHDISIINTQCKVEAYQGKNNLNEAVKGSDIVLIGDDSLSTPHTCFDIMAPKMQDYAKAIAENSPNAVIIVAASPINKLVPVLSELLLENGYYDCNKVIGSTAVNIVRANCILASYVQSDPRKMFLPVIGGDSEKTIVPLFSQAKPYFNISEAVISRLIDEIKQANTLIFEMKGSSEALNKAYSTVKFLNSVMAGLKGEPNIMNIAFTRTTQVDGVEYFALPVLLGRFGIQARYGIPKILNFENDLINESVFNLKKDIDFAKIFCKSRDTAVELCSRNVANKFQKSKVFEKFVNELKINKKGEKSDDKIINKIKPPIQVENGQYISKSREKPFDPFAFCSKHQANTTSKDSFLPPNMNSGASFMPYTFPKENRIAPGMAKSFPARTAICEPLICPDQPTNKPINYSNIVSLVEKLVKQATEKMMDEKEKDRNMKIIADKIDKSSYNSRTSENTISKGSHIAKSEAPLGTSNNNYRPENIKQCHPITNEMVNRKGNEIDFDECKTCNKRKYSEKNPESIFRPTLKPFKKSDEYKIKANQLKGVNLFKGKTTNPDSHNINIKQENNFCVTETAKPKSVSDSHKIKNFNNQLIPQSLKYNRKSLPTDDSSANSTSIKRILNMLNDEKPKQIATKNKTNVNYFENSCTQKKAISENLDHCHDSKEPEKYILPLDKRDFSRNQVITKKSPEPLLIQKKNRENLESTGNEKYFTNITKDKKNKYFNERYKYINAFPKIFNIKNNNKKNVSSIDENNTLVDKVESRQNKDMFTDKYEKERKLSEVLITQNKKSERPKSLNDQSIQRNTKDEKEYYLKHRLRNENSICKLHNIRNDSSRENNLNLVTPMKEQKDATKKVNEPVKSISYSISEKKVKKIHEIENRSPSNIRMIKKNFDNNNDNKQNISNLNEVEISTVSTCKKQDQVKSQENCNGTQTGINGKDLNILLRILDKEVFKCDNTLDQNKALEDKITEENKQSENKSPLNDDQKDKEDISTPSPNQISKGEGSVEIDYDGKGQVTAGEDECQPKNEKGSNEVTKLKDDSECNNTKPTSQPSEKYEISNLSDIDNDGKSLLDKFNSNPIENKAQSKNVKPVLKADSGCHGKEAISLPSEYHYTISSRNMHQKLFPEAREYQEQQSYLQNLKHIRIIDGVCHNKEKIVQFSNKPNATYKDNYIKPHLKIKATHASENPKQTANVKPKSSFTISDRSTNKERDSNRDIGKVINSNYREQICRNCKKLLNSNKSTNQNVKNNDSKIEFINHVKSQNNIESNKQRYDSKQKLLPTNLKSKVLGNHSSTSLITSKLVSQTNKKGGISVFNTLSEQIGSKVNEINKNEHTLKIKDKNGMNNFFLLKGLLPKVVNTNARDEKKTVNEKEDVSVLKSKVYQSLKTNVELKSSQLKNKNKEQYAMQEKGKELDSLLITHNSVYSPKCPVHGYKYQFNKNHAQSKPLLHKDTDVMSYQNSDVLSNLCRISTKINCNKSNCSSQRLNQKATYVKPYSTSAHLKNRSPSRLLLDIRKNIIHCPTTTKHFQLVPAILQKPNEFIKKKQKITKILEQSVKKITPSQKSDLYKTLQNNECNCFRRRETSTLNEVDKTKCRFLTEPIVPFHPEIKSRRTVKIIEQFFNRGFDSSYAKNCLKIPPNVMPTQCPWIHCSNKNRNNGNSSISRIETQSFNIDWSTMNNNKKFGTISDSKENDILVRGTCLEHVKNKHLTNDEAMSIRKYRACGNEPKMSNSSMETASISNAYSEYTKDFIKSEYTKSHTLPTIRQLHEKAFQSSKS